MVFLLGTRTPVYPNSLQGVDDHGRFNTDLFLKPLQICEASADVAALSMVFVPCKNASPKQPAVHI